MKRIVITLSAPFSLLLLLVAFAQLVHARTEPWTDGQEATFVIGQPNFNSGSAGRSATQIDFPRDVAIDVEHGKIYVADYRNERILRYAYPFSDPQPAAEVVFGQPDFTTAIPGTTQTMFSGPIGIDVDNTGRLWVAEVTNRRVVWFDDAYTIDSNQPSADGVLGQPDFETRAITTTQSSFASVFDIVVDASGSLYVADTTHNRVLRFDDAANKGNGAPADGVLGQPDFITSSSATTQDGMNAPRGLALYNGALFVGDRNNRRVLRFDDAANKADGAPADGVLGQPDFVSNTSLTTQSGMSSVGRLAVDDAGRLYVADIFSNQRILIFDDAASLPNGAPASNVLGQADFTSAGAGIGPARINSDSGGGGIAIDHTNNRLFFSDDLSNRVIGFQAAEPLAYPILAISKVGPAAVLANDLITYTLTITNNGSAPATSVVITDVLPAGVDYVGGGVPGAGDVVSWDVADLAVGDHTSVQLTVRATSVGSVSNDTYGASATYADTVTGAQGVTTEVSAAPLLSIDKDGPSSAVTSQTVVYTITVANSGTASATGGVLSDIIPAGLTFVEGSTTLQPSSAGVTGDAPTLVSALTVGMGQTVTITYEVLVAATEGDLTNTASVTATEQPEPLHATHTLAAAANECVASGSGDWSIVFAGCRPGAKYIIPVGVHVTLDQDIELDGDFELLGTLDPGDKTVTLTGGEDQTLSGDPLTFYNLALQKATRRSMVNINGKLEVQNELRIWRGRLRSASDFHHVIIEIEGVLELTSDITVSGDWTNDGEFVAGSNNVIFDGDDAQAIGGSHSSLFFDLSVAQGADVTVAASPGISNTVTNDGILRQTQALNGSPTAPATFHFLQLSGDKYEGLELSTAAGLGEVTVAIAGNNDSCAAAPINAGYRNRCVAITVQNGGDVALTLHTTEAEDDVDGDTLTQLFSGVWSGVWSDVEGAACGAADGASCDAPMVTLASGDNHLLIRGEMIIRTYYFPFMPFP